MTIFRILLISAVAFAMQAQPPKSSSTVIQAGRLIDVRAGRVLNQQSIRIENDRIREIGPTVQAPGGAKVIDLSNAPVLPGLIDNHTHLLLNGDITASDYDDQLLKQSIAYRAISATAAARTALMNGFTTMRDLETEGAMYADVDIKTAIQRGVIPGPRNHATLDRRLDVYVGIHRTFGLEIAHSCKAVHKRGAGGGGCADSAVGDGLFE